MLKVICVVDNAALRSSHLWAEHGLAFWIATETGVILLDTGQSGDVLCHNMDELRLENQAIRAVAVSHAHYDHTGGLTALAGRISPGLPLYANAALLRERFAQRGGNFQPIGLPVDKIWLHAHFMMHLHQEPQQILPDVWTTGAITTRPYPQGGSRHHFVYNGKGYVADTYDDDLSLVIEIEAGLVLICGCCHAGLLNTMEHVQRIFNRPIVLIAGGTHLSSADNPMLVKIAQTLASGGTIRRIYLNHCSGELAYCTLRHYLGDDKVHPCPAGSVIDIEDIFRD
jgi:7,8-dihydropterin-6-yl-methyl-4-(beta-D-ribofuranosyl)aminobenzene 5'-phosphate synthase